jgi:hypothetical protein
MPAENSILNRSDSQNFRLTKGTNDSNLRNQGLH